MTARATILALLLLLNPMVEVAAADIPAERKGEPGPKSDERSPFLGGFLRETRVIYPLKFDGWEAQGEHLYDVQELGASVRYAHNRHPGRWIDLYFYPAGILDAKQFDEAMLQQREMLEAAVQPGGYSEMELGETQSFTYRLRDADGGKGDETKGHSLDLHAVRDDHRLNSAMTLQVENLYFVKGRMSLPEDDLSRRATRKLLEDFVSGLAGKLTIVSTGECWMPMPIEPLVADAKSQPHLFTVDKDGKDNVVVTQDKVLAVEPKSPEAHVAMMLGMSMTGRFIDGCQSVEDLNNSVEEGMRELRLEYHAPEDGLGGQAPRLRPARSDRG